MERNLTSKMKVFASRQQEHEMREKVNSIVEQAMTEYDNKLEELRDSKPWIVDAEKKDVKDKMTEISDWLKEKMAAQNKKELFEDPVFKSNEVVKKMANLKKLYSKVAGKKKPKAEKKKVEEKKDDEENKTEEDGEKKTKDQSSQENDKEKETSDL